MYPSLGHIALSGQLNSMPYVSFLNVSTSYPYTYVSQESFTVETADFTNGIIM